MSAIEEARKRFPPIWTIYDHPRDYPEHFVVRLWYGLVCEQCVALFATAHEAREYIHSQGTWFCMRRAPTDDPKILESWL